MRITAGETFVCRQGGKVGESSRWLQGPQIFAQRPAPQHATIKVTLRFALDCSLDLPSTPAVLDRPGVYESGSRGRFSQTCRPPESAFGFIVSLDVSCRYRPERHSSPPTPSQPNSGNSEILSLRPIRSASNGCSRGQKEDATTLTEPNSANGEEWSIRHSWYD